MITFLSILIIGFLALEVLSVIIMIGVVVVDWSWYRDLFMMDFSKSHREKILKEAEKAKLRLEKEKSATGGFFEESYVRGFGTTGELLYRGEHRYPSYEAKHYAKLMDDRVDTEIFTNTEEL